MTDKKLTEIGKWLNTQGYDIDLSDELWMEDYRWGEHKTRDIIELLEQYLKNELQKYEEYCDSLFPEIPADIDLRIQLIDSYLKQP